MDGYYPVTDTFKFDDKEVFEIEFENGDKVKCSGDHKYLGEHQWVSVYEMLSEQQMPIVERILI
jgi:intein/homing endonuclease